jgi:hypothetical protein
MKRRTGWVVIDDRLVYVKPEPKPDKAELRARANSLALLLEQMAAKRDFVGHPFRGAARLFERRYA